MKHLIILFCLFGLNSFSQDFSEYEIDSICSEWNKKNEPGGIVGIIQNGDLVFEKGYGLANLNHKVPITVDTKFYLASTSKQFTAASVILLIQRGDLSFDNTLSDFFPEFPKYAENITIKNLLNHTSGLRDYIGLMWHKFHMTHWYDSYSDKEIIDLLSLQESVQFEAGDQFEYSNTNYFLLAQIIQKVTKTSFSEFVQKNIFDALKMDNSLIYDKRDLVIPNQAASYYVSEKGQFINDGVEHIQTGATGVYSTIEDFKKWDDAFYSSSHFNEEFWELMTEKAILNNGDTVIYACGLEIEKYKGLNTIHHAGALAGYRSHMVRFPDHKLTIVAFGNHARSNPYGKAYLIADLILKDHIYENPIIADSRAKPKQKKISLAKLKKFEGEYWSNEKTRFVKFYVENDTIFYQDLGLPWPLLYVGNNSLAFSDGETIKFDTISNKTTFKWVQHLTNGSTRIITGEKKDNISITPEKLMEYVGLYYCQEIDVIYELKLDDLELNLFVGGKKSELFQMINTDKCYENSSVFEFKRNEVNQITGFTINTYDGYELNFDRTAFQN